jgi:hypothetical protein
MFFFTMYTLMGKNNLKSQLHWSEKNKYFIFSSRGLMSFIYIYIYIYMVVLKLYG